MRPSRTFLFFSLVIVSLSLLSAFVTPERWRGFLNLHTSDKLTADSLVLTSVSLGSDSLPHQPSPVPDTSAAIVSMAPDTYNAAEAVEDTTGRGGQYRIMFYGDSQLEGDRMTSLMRSRLRRIGGGTGTGLFSPVMPVMYTRSFVIKSSSDWKRYTWLDYKRGKLNTDKFGPLLSLCRFTAPGERADKPVRAWVRVTPASGADSAASVYDNLRIIYGNLADTVEIKVFCGAARVAADILLPGADLSEYRCELSGYPEVVVEFTGRSSPDVYAMSIESNDGVVVDNIPMRGSAGLEFVMTDEDSFRESLSLLKPDLIILQYGLNVVRNVRSDYSYYEEGLIRQITFLRRVSGNTPLLLVSVTDMAETRGDSIRYFANIPAIRDAQKRAAERTGILFWDAWDAMGGRGSIVKWADKQPALALDDLTHLSYAGADTITIKMLADIFFPGGSNTGDESVVTPCDTMAVAAPDSLTAVQGPSTDAAGGARGAATVRAITDTMFRFFRYDPDDPFIFTSKGFWIFLLFVLLGFATVARHSSIRNAWLLLVSLWFYYRAGGLFFILLLFTALVNYLAGLLIYSSGRRAARRFFLTVSVVSGLGLLAYFKYTAFITESVNSLLGTSFVSFDFLSAWSNTLLGTHFDVSEIVLPVGISFFTFQALSYTIDIYRNKVKPVRSFIDFAFYVAFFPHLVAGPIVRASEFVPQMYREYSLTRNEWSHALFLILQGLIKKMIISDFIATGFVDRIFDNPSLFSGFENLLAVYGYGIQIYCDFSGYTEIAIGIAMLMGFRLPVNFNSPYKASSITEFWKRWHISLSRWLKDYLYIPLGGNRKGSFRTGINLMITMILGGLWHGASLRFLIWGGLHGAGLVLDKVRIKITGAGSNTLFSRAAGIFLTFHFVSFAWIFFRTSSGSDAMIMLNRIFTDFNPGSYKAVVLAYMPALILIVSAYILHFVPTTVKESYRGLFIRMPLWLKFAAVIGVCLVIYKVGTEVTQPFIYFRF